MSILDALAGVCLYERRHQSFAVSMSIGQGPTPGVTLYVSQNGTVPQFVVDHLLDIRARLAQIKMLSVEDIEDSGMAQKAMDDLEVSLYLHSFEKLRHRLSKAESEHGLDDCSDYVKRATKDSKTTPEERSLLLDLLSSVNKLRQLMVGHTRPSYAAVKATVDIIKQLWGKWTPMLKNHSSTLARWDCLHGDCHVSLS